MIDFGFHNMDCMEGMKEFPDNYFDLAVCDPPYGDGKLSDNSGGGGTTNSLRFHGGSKNSKKDPWNRYRRSQEQEAHGRADTVKKL